MEGQQRRQTPRQILWEHLVEYHRGVRISKNDTLIQLQGKHGNAHYRLLVTSHYHEGPNLGVGQRPPGWHTGKDVVLLKPPKGY
jgi:hypothetical protein